eukprot:jgi/Tetstr1/435020/TSEL_023991.t1
MHRGITLGADSVDNLRLVGYADADFAPADPLQRRSRGGIHLKMLVSEILGNPVQPLIMLEDIHGAISYATKTIISDKTKHIDVKWHFGKDYHVVAGTVKVSYIATDLNMADMMTIPLHRPTLDDLTNTRASLYGVRWAHIIRDIILKEGLKLSVPGNPEASCTNFYVNDTYLDDFLLKFDSSLSRWQHDFMHLSCINTLHKHGLSIKHAKSEWPSTRCEFVGVLIDTVILSDALGWAGDVWCGATHLTYAYTPERLERLGTSAILCELIMVPWTNEQIIGTQLTTGSNVLFRLDNTSLRFDIELIARHSPARENTLADCLSRLRGAIDDQDWRLLVATFHELEAACGPFDVDASSDSPGRN